MRVLIYNSYEDALSAISIINNNMGYPLYNGDKLIANNWDIPTLTINNTWVFLAPEEQYLINISNYTILNVTSDYFYIEPDDEETMYE